MDACSQSLIKSTSTIEIVIKRDLLLDALIESKKFSLCEMLCSVTHECSLSDETLTFQLEESREC